MTMILPKYEPHFEKLTSDQALYLARAMGLPDERSEPLAGHDLYEIATSAGMDQADVVMSLATDITPTGVEVIETIVGRPIQRSRPVGASPRSAGPRRTSNVKKSDPRKISWVGDKPKKQGSSAHARIAHNTVGDTVDQIIAKGGTMGDVKWDHERGFIKLEGDE